MDLGCARPYRANKCPRVTMAIQAASFGAIFFVNVMRGHKIVPTLHFSPPQLIEKLQKFHLKMRNVELSLNQLSERQRQEKKRGNTVNHFQQAK